MKRRDVRQRKQRGPRPHVSESKKRTQVDEKRREERGTSGGGRNSREEFSNGRTLGRFFPSRSHSPRRTFLKACRERGEHTTETAPQDTIFPRCVLTLFCQPPSASHVISSLPFFLCSLNLLPGEKNTKTNAVRSDRALLPPPSPWHREDESDWGRNPPSAIMLLATRSRTLVREGRRNATSVSKWTA